MSLRFALPIAALALSSCATAPGDVAFRDLASIPAPPSAEAEAAWDAAVTRAVAATVTPRDEPPNDCDRLAADPLDPQRAGPGVTTDAINVARAEPACALAVDLFGHLPRFRYQLARIYARQGRFREAQPHLAEAAEAGYAAAQEALGALYFARGRTANLNLEPAFNLFRAAGNGGALNAQYALGGLLAGPGAPPEAQAEGLAWTRRAAEGGHPRAMTRLARAILRGETGEEPPAAEPLLRRAAELDDPQAMFTLGAVLTQGLFGAPDLQGGLDALRDAAAWGHPNAQALAGLGLIGLGPFKTPDDAFSTTPAEPPTARDPAEAYVWLTLADRAGMPNAAALRDGFAEGFSAEDRAALAAAADGWSPGAPPALPETTFRVDEEAAAESEAEPAAEPEAAPEPEGEPLQAAEEREAEAPDSAAPEPETAEPAPDADLPAAEAETDVVASLEDASAEPAPDAETEAEADRRIMDLLRPRYEGPMDCDLVRSPFC